jgi:hypothetical protein
MMFEQTGIKSASQYEWSRIVLLPGKSQATGMYGSELKGELKRLIEAVTWRAR